MTHGQAVPAAAEARDEAVKTVRPTAVAKGLPPKVVPWVPGVP